MIAEYEQQRVTLGAIDMSFVYSSQSVTILTRASTCGTGSGAGRGDVNPCRHTSRPTSLLGWLIGGYM